MEEFDNIDIDARSKLFKASEFIEWLKSVSPDWINIKDLEMYVSKYYELKPGQK